jgi:hypothetical protein
MLREWTRSRIQETPSRGRLGGGPEQFSPPEIEREREFSSACLMGEPVARTRSRDELIA